MEGRRRALVVLCGLPGAGKTTLARRLEAWLGEEEEEEASGGGADKQVVRADRINPHGSLDDCVEIHGTRLQFENHQEVHYVGFDAIEAGLRSEGVVPNTQTGSGVRSLDK